MEGVHQYYNEGPYIYEVSQHLVRPHGPIKAYSKFGIMLKEMGIVNVGRNESVKIKILLDETDLASESDFPVNHGDIPPPRRYWWPKQHGTTVRFDIMCKMPKAILTFRRNSKFMDPVEIEYFFWENYERVANISISELNYEGLLNACSSRIKVVEPFVEDGMWEIPIWKPLPGKYSSMNPVFKAKALISKKE